MLVNQHLECHTVHLEWHLLYNIYTNMHLETSVMRLTPKPV